MNEGLSLFGDKVRRMIQDAKDVSNSLKFTNKVTNTIDDLLAVINVSMESIKKSVEMGSPKTINPFLEPFAPEIESIASEDDQINIDKLIADSYNYGKSDVEMADSFKKDLDETIRDFAWLFVAIGIALDNEDKKDIINILKVKAQEIQEREAKLVSENK